MGVGGQGALTPVALLKASCHQVAGKKNVLGPSWRCGRRFLGLGQDRRKQAIGGGHASRSGTFRDSQDGCARPHSGQGQRGRTCGRGVWCGPRRWRPAVCAWGGGGPQAAGRRGGGRACGPRRGSKPVLGVIRHRGGFMRGSVLCVAGEAPPLYWLELSRVARCQPCGLRHATCLLRARFKPFVAWVWAGGGP